MFDGIVHKILMTPIPSSLGIFRTWQQQRHLPVSKDPYHNYDDVRMFQ